MILVIFDGHNGQSGYIGILKKQSQNLSNSICLNPRYDNTEPNNDIKQKTGI